MAARTEVPILVCVPIDPELAPPTAARLLLPSPSAGTTRIPALRNSSQHAMLLLRHRPMHALRSSAQRVKLLLSQKL